MYMSKCIDPYVQHVRTCMFIHCMSLYMPCYNGLHVGQLMLISCFQLRS